MPEGFQDLQAKPGREVRASCGCAFVECAPRALDTRDGKFLTGHTLVVVPCSDAHRDPALQACVQEGDIERACEAFEKAAR